jgi:hypothetical protein
MAHKKISNLKIVQQQTPTEAELQAKYQREKLWKDREVQEDSWRLTRQEITARVRALRIELEAARARLEGMTFDVVTDDALDPHSMSNREKSSVTDLVDAFDPCILGHYKRVENLVGESCVHDDLSNLKWQTSETAFQIGILQGAIFAGCSDREIDRLERGLIHATVSRKWRCKDRG